MASHTDNRRGIAAMLGGVTLFVLNDALMKLARETFPASQAIALRSSVALVAALAMVLAFREARKLHLARHPALLLRGLMDGVAAIAMVWSLKHIELGLVTAILQAQPLIIVALAVLMRIEVIGWRRTLAILVGFAGVLIILRPGTAGLQPAALAVLFSAVLGSLRDLLTRRIASDVPSTVISLSTIFVIMLVGFAAGIGEAWVPFWRVEALLLVASAVLVTLAGLLIIVAFRIADIGAVTHYRYASVVMAMAIGYFVWGEVPDLVAAFGAALIVGSGLYMLRRQRARLTPQA